MTVPGKKTFPALCSTSWPPFCRLHSLDAPRRSVWLATVKIHTLQCKGFSVPTYSVLQTHHITAKFKFEGVTVHSFTFKFKFGIVILSRLKLSKIEPPQRIYAGRRICSMYRLPTGSRTKFSSNNYWCKIF